MNETYSHRSELAMSQKKKEKQSPRRKKDLSDFYTRNDDLNLKKKQLYQFGEGKKVEKENQNIDYVKTVRYYRPAPFTAPKKSESLWDEDGNLIPENIHNNKDAKRKDDEDSNQKKARTELTKIEFNDFLKRNQGQTTSVSKQEHQRVVPQNKNNFDNFLKRQEESIKNRNKKHPLPKQKSYISKKSSELAIKASKKTPNKNGSNEIEYSFRPDMSKTLKNNVNKLPVELAEAQLVLKNIELESLRIALDAERNKDTTNPSKKKQAKKSSKKDDTNLNTENLQESRLRKKSPSKIEN